MFEYFGGGGGHNYDGYVAEFHYIDGSNVAATEFAEYDDNNNWVPKYEGSYGSSDVGFYLNLLIIQTLQLQLWVKLLQVMVITGLLLISM